MNTAAVYQKEGENCWVTYCKRRVASNNSLNIAIVGEPGSGKSWATIAFARAYNPNWSLDNMYFSAADLMRDIANNKFPPGSLIAFDEAGVDLASSKWQDTINKAFSLLYQTMRHKNWITIVTLPALPYLSKGVRRLMTSVWESRGWDRKTKECKIKPLILQYNSALDKLYKKRLVILKRKEDMVLTSYCSQILIPPPPPELMEEYERRKTAFTGNLFLELADEIDEMNAKKKHRPLTDKQEECLKHFKEGRNLHEVSVLMGVTEAAIRVHMRYIKKKGIRFKPIKEHTKVVRYEVLEE